MQIINTMLSSLAALMLFFSFALPSNMALAQQSAIVLTAPKIEGFDVEPARRLSAGNELTFTLYGTPGGTANVRINGVAGRIFLDEVEAGVYEGTYTIKKKDRLTANTGVTANLRVGNQIAADVLDESILVGAASRTTRAAATPAVAVLKIDSLDVDPPARLQSGEQLFFTLHGTPGAKASLRIVGVKGKLLMEEVKSGTYETTYTIKDRDRIGANATVTATLQQGTREVSATLGRRLMAAPTPTPSPRHAAAVCANCGVVEAINVVEVRGDGTYVGKIAGGVVGGLLGSQVGQGRGTTVAEIAGAVGGAVVGNEIEKRVKKTTHYEVLTRLQGGGMQTINYATQPPFRVGDKVRIENGVLVSNQ
jgi:outer membrane lipoprotein SlyB